MLPKNAFIQLTVPSRNPNCFGGTWLPFKNVLLFIMFIFRYDFVCLPVVHPRFKREFIEGPAQKRGGAFTRSDMLLTSQGKNQAQKRLRRLKHEFDTSTHTQYCYHIDVILSSSVSLFRIGTV